MLYKYSNHFKFVLMIIASLLASSMTIVMAYMVQTIPQNQLATHICVVQIFCLAKGNERQFLPPCPLPTISLGQNVLMEKKLLQNTLPSHRK